MAHWFGHGQTVATISKGVTTVAGGCIALERNVANFMCKIIYYEKFFQRNEKRLPTALMHAVTRLIKRCYCYRDGIRDELESSIAYVADAGRWMIGLDDWNTRMERRFSQLTELVVLANSLLVEASLNSTEQIASTQELQAFVQVIVDTIPKDEPRRTENSTQKNENVPMVVDRSKSPPLFESPRPSFCDEDESFNPFNEQVSCTSIQTSSEDVFENTTLIVQSLLDELVENIIEFDDMKKNDRDKTIHDLQWSIDLVQEAEFNPFN